MHTDTDIEPTIALLAQAAAEHDKQCEETAEHTDDCPQHQCWDYRRELAARVMFALGLDLTDIGFVADDLISVECEESAEELATDGVLDATEVGGEA